MEVGPWSCALLVSCCRNIKSECSSVNQTGRVTYVYLPAVAPPLADASSVGSNAGDNNPDRPRAAAEEDVSSICRRLVTEHDVTDSGFENDGLAYDIHFAALAVAGVRWPSSFLPTTQADEQAKCQEERRPESSTRRQTSPLRPEIPADTSMFGWFDNHLLEGHLSSLLSIAIVDCRSRKALLVLA